MDFPIVSRLILPAASIKNTLLRCKKNVFFFKEVRDKKEVTSYNITSYKFFVCIVCMDEFIFPHIATCTDMQLYIYMFFHVHFFQKLTTNTGPTVKSHELPSASILNFSPISCCFLSVHNLVNTRSQPVVMWINQKESLWLGGGYCLYSVQMSKLKVTRSKKPH